MSLENEHMLEPETKIQEMDLSIKSLGKQMTIQPVKTKPYKQEDEPMDFRGLDPKNLYYYERIQQQIQQQQQQMQQQQSEHNNISALFGNFPPERGVSSLKSSQMQVPSPETSIAAAAAAAAAARIQLMSQMFMRSAAANQADFPGSHAGSLLEQASVGAKHDSIPTSSASLFSAATARAIAASTFASFHANAGAGEAEDPFMPTFSSASNGTPVGVDLSTSSVAGQLPVSSLLSAAAAAAAASGYPFNPSLFMSAAAAAAAANMSHQHQQQQNQSAVQGNGNVPLMFHNGTEKRGRGRPPKYGNAREFA